MVKGNVHSIETFGTVDGPGIRMVVFMQGCPMRCLYCHNPDTWGFNKNKEVSVEEILDKYDGIKEFLKNGGITVTGGEPLAQIDFVIELFQQAQKKNIHTALDTSGILFNELLLEKIEKLLNHTNLVLLDIKHIDDTEHKKLTGFSNKNVLEFAKYLSAKNIPVWIRHVVVPEITLKEEYLQKLGEFLSSLKNVKALDVLAYHDMAVPKYNQLGIEYPLKSVVPPQKEEVIQARNIILNAMKNNSGENLIGE